MMTTLSRVVKKFLEPSLENVNSKSFLCFDWSRR